MAKLSDVSENILEICLFFLNFVKKCQKNQMKIIAFFGKVFDYYWTNPVFFDIIYMYSCVRGKMRAAVTVLSQKCVITYKISESQVLYMDYNTQRKIMKALAEKGKNPLLFLPCLMARVLVAAFMSAWRFVDMSLSDREGNFLGIKRKAHARQSLQDRRAAREEQRLREAVMRSREADVQRERAVSVSSVMEEDGFSERELRKIRGSLPYRSFGARCASFGLAAAFALTVVPEIGVSAALVGDSGGAWKKFSAYGDITADDLNVFYMTNFGSNESVYINELDLYNEGDPDGEMLNIANGLFNDMPSLTMITLGYSTNGGLSTNVTGNFRNIGGGDAVILVKGSENAEEGAISQQQIISQLQGQSETKVIPDDNDEYYRKLMGMGAISSFNARDGIGSVILEWSPMDSNGDVVGYAIYSVETKVNSATGQEEVGRYNRLGYFYPANASNDNPKYSVIRDGSRMKCRAVVKVPSSASERYYAIRPFMVVRGYNPMDTLGEPLCGPVFTTSDRAAKAFSIRSTPPTLNADVNGFDVNLTVSNVDDNASYVKIYSTNRIALSGSGQETLSDYEHMVTIPVVRGTTRYTAHDPYSLGITGRKYVAVMVYDVFDEYRLDQISNYAEFAGKIEVSETAALVASNPPYIVDGPSISPPDTFLAYVHDGKLCFSWDWDNGRNPWLNIRDGRIAYQITVDGKVVNSTVNDGMLEGVNFVEVEADEYLTGDTGTAMIRTFFIPDSGEALPSDFKSAQIDVTAPQITAAKPGNRCFELEWLGVDGAVSYTIYWQSTAGGTVYNTFVDGADAEAAVAGQYKTKVENVSNITYEVWVAANGVSNASPSAKVRVTPSTAPPAPYNLTAETADKAVTLMWDGEAEEYIVEVYTNDTGSGVPVKTLEGVRERTCKLDGLDNGRTYSFRVWSVKKVEGEPILSTESAFIKAMPYPNVAMVNSILVVPQDITIKLSWNAADGANKYYVKKISEDGSQEIFSVGSATGYEDGAVKNNVLYTYSVMGVTESDGKDYPEGDEYFSVPQSGKINVYVPAVQGLTAQADDGKVTLKWEKADKADGYIINLYEGGQWRELTRVSDTQFEHTGLTNGREYQYQVIAYRMVNLGRDIVASTAVSPSASATAGRHFPAPLDFKVTAGDGLVNLEWAAVDDAEGYEIQVADIYGGWHSFDVVTKNSAVHSGLSNGTSITYRVRAFKTVSGERVYSDFTLAKTAVVGTFLNAPTDIAVKTGDMEVELSWKSVDGAEGYVVYSYNPTTSSFTPVGIVTSTSFKHTGLVNGRTYTYMVAAYKTVNGEIRYSAYSLAATAVPMGKGTNNGTNNNSNNGNNSTNPNGYRIFITGTTPYGMSNSNLISAFAENGAFDDDIDVRFTWSAETTTTVQDVLEFYGNGLESFMVYPMDISLYKSGTDQKTTVKAGYYLTLTIPVPDELLPYSDQISVVHISDDGQLEILPSTHVAVSGVDCMQFQATSFSPYAFVVYSPQNGEDFAAGGSAVSSASMQYQLSASPVLMCTSLPTIYGRRRRNKVYRIVK